MIRSIFFCVAFFFAGMCALQAQTETIIHNFANPAPKGSNPDGLIRGPSGNLFGVAGVVYELSAKGKTVLYSFPPGDAYPNAGLVADAAGNLYGTTNVGGALNFGLVFKVTPSGQETVLYSFTGGLDGGYPNGDLAIDSAGNLYGTTESGGLTCTPGEECGVVFELSPGGTETVLFSFTEASGWMSESGLVRDAAGDLYGTTVHGGDYNSGAVYKVDKSGNETTLFSFFAGFAPLSGLTMDSHGNLYGTTYSPSGASGANVLYEVPASGPETTVHTFSDGQDSSRVIFDSAGNLYGTAFGISGSFVYEISSRGQFGVLYNFPVGTGAVEPSGEEPLLLDSAGDLYGTGNGGPTSLGVVYKVTPTGQETVLLTFVGSAGGSHPAGLIRSSSGDLYGTTSQGGVDDAGVVYKTDGTGKETLLYSFTGGADGSYPYFLASDGAGNLYGTTSSGGTKNLGLIYKIDSTGHETMFYSFQGQPDGALPTGSLVIDAAGNLYGTTFQGGADNLGAVYKVGANGQETVLFSFDGRDGNNPNALVLGANGTLYGTTSNGGAGPLGGGGVVYKLDASGHETVLHSFSGSPDGIYAESLIRDSSGNLYGTTLEGGANDLGAIFKIDTTGTESVIYSFVSGPNRVFPGALLDVGGNLYGTSPDGGTNSDGFIYELSATGQFTILYSFAGLDGSEPVGLVSDSAGNLYGTVSNGGSQGSGAIFELQGAIAAHAKER